MAKMEGEEMGGWQEMKGNETQIYLKDKIKEQKQSCRYLNVTCFFSNQQHKNDEGEFFHFIPSEVKTSFLITSDRSGINPFRQ